MAYNKIPYRQEPNLLSYDKVFKIRDNSFLKISDSSYRYLSEAQQKMRLAGFEKGEYILDMTGRSPGFIYAINGKPLLAPWILGGYSGSNNLLEYLISKEESINFSFL